MSKNIKLCLNLSKYYEKPIIGPGLWVREYGILPYIVGKLFFYPELWVHFFGSPVLWGKDCYQHYDNL